MEFSEEDDEELEEEQYPDDMIICVTIRNNGEWIEANKPELIEHDLMIPEVYTDVESIPIYPFEMMMPGQHFKTIWTVAGLPSNFIGTEDDDEDICDLDFFGDIHPLKLKEAMENLWVELCVSDTLTEKEINIYRNKLIEIADEAERRKELVVWE